MQSVALSVLRTLGSGSSQWIKREKLTRRAKTSHKKEIQLHRSFRKLIHRPWARLPCSWTDRWSRTWNPLRPTANSSFRKNQDDSLKQCRRSYIRVRLLFLRLLLMCESLLSQSLMLQWLNQNWLFTPISPILLCFGRLLRCLTRQLTSFWAPTCTHPRWGS